MDSMSKFIIRKSNEMKWESREHGEWGVCVCSDEIAYEAIAHGGLDFDVA